MPRRIQRRRVKGWRLPANAVSITRPGRFGNPYKIGELSYDVAGDTYEITKENCLTLFERYAIARQEAEPEWLATLRGKDLACFCKEGNACHGDILLRLANA